MDTLMKCGHTAQAVDENKNPVCVICYGDPNAKIVDSAPPSLDGREMMCPYCKRAKPSSCSGAFFEHRPDRPYDSYYCGCRGWD